MRRSLTGPRPRRTPHPPVRLRPAAAALRTALLFVLTPALLPLLPAPLRPGGTELSAQLHSVRLGSEVGRVIPVSIFEQGTNRAGRAIRTTTHLSVELGWRWSDPEFGVAEYGFGVERPDFRGTDELGSPVSLYGFTRLPVAGGPDRALLTFDALFGATVGWDAFHPVDNPRQISIGSPLTATFALGLSGAAPVGERFAVTVTARYHHWSNGNLRQPNTGMNSISGGLGVEWRPGGRVEGPGGGGRGEGSVGNPSATVGQGAADPGEASVGRDALFLRPFVGARGLAADPRHTEQDDGYERQLLPVAGVHAGVRRRVSRLWSVAAAFNGTLDSSGFRDHREPALRDGRLDPEPAVALGVSTSAFLRTGPVELEAGIGYAALDLGGERGISRWSQRLGVHFTGLPGATPSVVLRALGFDRPNFIEWGVSIR